MIYTVKHFVCDDCALDANFISIEDARSNGWVVGRDRNRCFCPACGWKHCNTGRKHKYSFLAEYSNSKKVHLDLNE